MIQRIGASDRGAINDNMIDYVADRFTDESDIRRGRQLPYQYFAAYLNATAQPYSSNYDFRPKMRSIESDVCQINASG